MAMAVEERTSREGPASVVAELRTARASVVSLAQRFDPTGLRPSELTEVLR